jgi:RNA polymerase sigma factor (sigma-70 family)
VCADNSSSSGGDDMQGHPGPQVAHVADLALARAAAAQDPAAVATLTQRLACVPKFVRVANQSFGGVLQREDLEDVAQEALVTIWRRLGDYRGEASLETWSFRIADFSVRNAARRIIMRRSVTMEGVPEPAEDGTADKMAEIDALEVAMAALPPDEALVIRLKHYESLTFDQIGKTLGQSPNTIKTRYYRAMDLLRNKLCPPSNS